MQIPRNPETEPVENRRPVTWRLRTRSVDTADHTLVMGVVNLTPDSFSDGGAFGAEPLDHDRAVARALELAASGADIVDIGGESTRPGAASVAAEEEATRVLPAIARVAAEGIVVSVDTSKPEVAAAALEAGAEIVNDVTALSDPALAKVCAEAGCGVVLMHMQGTPRTMQIEPAYDDVVGEVAAALGSAADVAIAAGVDPEAICIDPGLGFGKTAGHNLELLNSLGRVAALGYPVLVGPSRKGFLGVVLAAAGRSAEPARRDPATAAAVAMAISAGAAVVRVHDVVGGLQAARTADAIVRASVEVSP